MFAPFAEVPGYPLVFIVFWGAAAFFLLAMARHLRVFAVARPSHPFNRLPTRVVSLVEYAFVQTKMFKDVKAGVMHAGIFWGFVLLTIGTANIVTGGIIQQVLSIPFDGLLWALISAMQNVVAVIVLVSIGWAYYRRLVSKPRRLTFNRDALLILGMIGGVVATELFAQVFEVAAYGDIPGAFVSNALAVPLRNLSPDILDAGPSAVLWWGHIALVAAFLCYLPFSKHLHIATAFPNIFFRKLEPRGELPKLDLEDENATFGLKTLQDLGWKDLLDGFTCTECGRCQEACPAWNTGKPLNPKEMIMGIRHMSVDAEHGIDIIPNSPIVRETYGLEDTKRLRGGAGQADRRRRDPVRRGLGLRDLRGVRRGLPGAHRARRQDRRAAPEPGPRGEPIPERADERLPIDGEPGQPVGPAGVGAARLDAVARVRGADGGVDGGGRAGSTSSTCCIGSAVRRRSTPATRRSRGRSRPACTRRACASRSSARRSRAPATRRGGWATTTSSRSWRRATSRRSTATGWGSGRS